MLKLSLPAVVLTLGPVGAETLQELKEQVRQAEIAFAKTMADRDHAAFVSFLAPDAIFFGPGGAALRGSEEVAKGWKKFL